MNSYNEDIDLGPLFNFFIRSVKKVLNGLVSLLRYVFRLKWKLFFFGIVFSLIGLVLALIIPKKYSSNFIAYSGGISSEFHADKIRDLDFLIEEDNYTLLSEKLDLPVEVVQKIEEIDYIEDDEILVDTLNQNYFFKVQVKTSDNSIFSLLQPKIVGYLSNISFYQKQIELKRQSYLSLISRLNSDIEELDSIRLIIVDNHEPKGKVGGIVFGEPLNPLEMYKEGYKLFNEQLQLKTKLESLEMIQVAKDFTVFRKPSFPKKSYFMVFSFAIGVLVAMIYYARK